MFYVTEVLLMFDGLDPRFFNQKPPALVFFYSCEGRDFVKTAKMV